MNLFACTTRLYKDAEQRFTQGGDSIVTFKGAVDAGFGNSKTTSWIRFNLWGKRGVSLLPYLKDKTQVAVSGELANREYTDKEGQKRYSLEVRVNELTLVGGNQSNDSAPAERSAPAPAKAAPEPQFDDLEDDTPFVSNVCYVSDMMGASKSLRRSRRGESVQSLFNKQAD